MEENIFGQLIVFRYGCTSDNHIYMPKSWESLYFQVYIYIYIYIHRKLHLGALFNQKSISSWTHSTTDIGIWLKSVSKWNILYYIH